jgi:tetratricopeptide (TPR) repeat protein
MIRTTNGTIAFANLAAQIDGLELHAVQGWLSSRSWAELVDLLIMRAHVLGRIADYERAVALAELRLRGASAEGLSFLSLARARGSLHRFKEALSELDVAEQLGIEDSAAQAERAAILQAVGRYDEALVLRRAAVERRADFESVAGLAALHAERGETAEAEPLFDESYLRYRGVSPFPLVQLEFQRGHMWREAGQPLRARDWFDAAWRRVPAYAQAEGHLAEVEAELGEREDAIARLRRLASESDDPDYAAQLARILDEDGNAAEADRWRARAEKRYGELVSRHPAAFADHAAEFWSSAGRDPQRAVGLAKLNLEVRNTPRARALLSRTIAACLGAPDSGGRSPTHRPGRVQAPDR